MKLFIKRRLTLSDLFLILVNLVPLWGVWFRDWNAGEVFIVYCLESIIAGLYNALMMLLALVVQHRAVQRNPAAATVKPEGYWIILFFLAHYGFFVFIQLSIFLGVTSIGDASGGVFPFLFHIRDYLSEPMEWVVLLLIASYGLYMVKDFILSGAYRIARADKLLFAPYARIFVQQFCVILGSFIIGLGAGKVFILIFVVIKLYFEYMLDPTMIIREATQPGEPEKAVKAS